MDKQPNSRMCFVCGIENPIGLKLKFYTDDEGRCVARFRPKPEHQGYPGHLHGGLISTLLGLGMGLVLSRLFVRAMNQLSNYNLAYVFPTSSLIAGLGIALVVSQLAALYPAWRAARLRIVEAIQHE